MSSRKPADKYLLDTCVCLDLKRHWGDPTEGHGIWGWFGLMIQAGIFLSVRTVRTELNGQQDAVTEWINGFDKRAFLPHGIAGRSALIFTIGPILLANGYKLRAVKRFFGEADGHLVARAAMGGYTVVTSEISKTTKSKVKIPDACRLVGVECIDLDTLLEREKAKFRRGSKDAKGK